MDQDIHKGPPLYTSLRKKVPGQMKDECNGRPIAEYVGLRPKMYSIREASGANIRKAKGVRKATVRTKSAHEQYRESLFRKEDLPPRNGGPALSGPSHLWAASQTGVPSLSPFDSKRWIAENGMGHAGLWVTGCRMQISSEPPHSASSRMGSTLPPRE
ncbi:hypothetical protein QZH41_003731 [Actinostola sp. cb2023]|nr:hypothetical protein QZH41_003731 [Actinostola sp. cb2023]